MPNDRNQFKKINEKWFTVGSLSILLAMMLPSILVSVKIAMRLAVILITALATKVAAKAISDVLKEKQEYQGDIEQQITKVKIINLVVGLLSILVGGLSLLTIAQIGLNATCSAVSALVLYSCFKDMEMCKDINNKLDEVADNTSSFIIQNIENLIFQQKGKVQ